MIAQKVLVPKKDLPKNFERTGCAPSLTQTNDVFPFPFFVSLLVDTPNYQHLPTT